MYIFLIVCGVFAFSACRSTEDHIKSVVQSEMANAWKHTPVLDGKVIGPYSPAQRVGNMLFLSGQIAMNPATGALENKDFETEVRQAMDNIVRILRASGFSEDDVVSTTVYLKDMNDFQTLNAIYGGYFREGNYPARTTVQVAALPKDARVEVAAIAVKSN